MCKFILRLFLFFSFSLCATVQAQDKKSVNFGHSISPTSQTLQKEVYTAGTVLAGYGVTDNLFISTSTWMLWGYNSYSFVGKYAYAFDAESFIDKIAIQFMYLKSADFNNISGSEYIMETLSTWLIITKKITSNYTLNLDINHMHFFDETNPHSFRREPFNNNPWQISLTTLQEIKIDDFNGLNFEIGVLGLNYRLPWLQTGFSYFYQTDNWHLQFGLSNSSVIHPTSPLLDNGTNSSRTAIHPEVQIQFFW